MAIKLPDPGNGIAEDETGYNEWENMKIVRDNFADESNAASRLVGNSNGQLPTINNRGIAGSGFFSSGELQALSKEEADTPNSAVRSGFYRTFVSKDNLVNAAAILQVPYPTGEYGAQIIVGITGSYLRFRRAVSSTAYSQTYTVYHDGNTTKDTATGFLKASSPVLHVYNDSITKIHEAEQLDIVVDKKGVGHYEIHGTTGLRKNDGWFMSPPRDVHGNVLSMVDLEEKDGVVILRTYKKKFDFETVSIVHDYENPMDIPDGVCVELRFNDLPQEQLDEPAI